MSEQIEWVMERREIEELTPHPQNPRYFTDKGMSDLKASIGRFGLAQPININRDGTVISGHARLETMRKMGKTEVDVYVPSRVLTPNEVDQLMVRMNKNEAGEWDNQMLQEFFNPNDLMAWGFEKKELPFLNEEKVDSFQDDDTPLGMSSSYKLIVECTSEADQEDLFNKLKDQGFKVKTLRQ